MTQPPSIPPRSAIAPEYTWNAESVFPTLQDWENELAALPSVIAEVAAYNGRLSQGPSILLEAIGCLEQMYKRALTLIMYARMLQSVDTQNQQAANMVGKAQSVVAQAIAAASFLNPELLTIGQEKLLGWVQQENGLAVYAHYIDDLFRKQAHVRSAEVEELLGELVDPFFTVAGTASLLTDADFKFAPAHNSQGEEIEITQSSLSRIYTGADAEARRSAWESYTNTYLAAQNTLANNLAASLKQQVFLSRARRHASVLDAVLFQDHIPTQVFHNLIEVFRANLPTWQRYFAIRRKALGVDELRPCDMWAPLTDSQPVIPYAQAVEWICESLAPMGEAYVQRLRQGALQDRWVDIYPNQGKSSGAFSYGSPGTHPFIMMSYTDNMLSMSTLAHELGHSMHSYLTWKTQPVLYGEYCSFVAEVASNFHQAMLRAYLLKTRSDPAFQISLIEEAMSNYFRYFFIMPTLARFEWETHGWAERGEGLSAGRMIDLMADLFSEAYGGQVDVDRRRVGITWATFSHLYQDYYVFQYATGISGADALARRVLSSEPGAVQDYLGFLQAGSSRYPLDVLRGAGVDLASPQPVEAAFQVLADFVERLEKLLQ